MAELLIKAINATHDDPATDRRGCYKRGMPVVVMPDGHLWGNGEQLPAFAVIKIPMISVAQVKKYIEPQIENDVITRRRLWRIRWGDLPLSARTRLETDGELTIKATVAYTGPFDYTWAQVKAYFLNQLTSLDEVADL